MAEHHHFEAVGRQLQQRYLLLKRRALAADILLAAIGSSLLATVLIKLAGWPVSLLLVYAVIGGLACLVWAVIAWWMRVTPLAVLMTADRVLGLQDCLSTAYEYMRQQADNRFVPVLTMEAEKASRRVDARLVFPARWPRRLWGIPLFVAALIAVARVDMTPFSFDDLAQEDVAEDVAEEGKRLERWGRRLEDLAQQEQLDRSLILARHMKQLGRRLQREGGKSGQASERISTLSQYLQRMQQELRERALMSDTGVMAVQDVLASGKSVKQELQNILQLLRGDHLPGEAKQLAEQGIQRLSRQLGNQAELSQLLQNLQAGNVAAARQLLQDIIQQQQVAEEMEHLERARRALQYSSRALEDGSSGESRATPQPSPGQQLAEAGQPFDFDEETMSEDMPGMEDFTLPGLGEDHGLSRHSKRERQRRLRESGQPASKVQVKSGEGRMRLGYARHLPLHNEARVTREQAVVQYRQAAEEILTQERIPRGYREQIKQYFLAIGMTVQEIRE